MTSHGWREINLLVPKETECLSEYFCIQKERIWWKERSQTDSHSRMKWNLKLSTMEIKCHVILCHLHVDRQMYEIIRRWSDWC